MTPGSVDLKIVTDRLTLVSEHIDELRALPAGSFAAFAADRRNPRAAEALLRRAIEALFDVARHLLAKGWGLGALEYREVARLCVQHCVVRDAVLAERMEQIAGFRNRLTHHYEDVTTAELFGVVSAELGDLAGVAEELRESAARLVASPPVGLKP